MLGVGRLVKRTLLFPCRESLLAPGAVLNGRSFMRVAAIDLGSARVGLAVSDDLGMLAHPRPYLDGKNMGRLVDALCALAVEEGLERFVIGLPRHLDGREGSKARAARHFAHVLEQQSGLPIEMADERWTTVEALARLRDQGLDAKRSRRRVDSAAAAILLQAWLDSRAGAER